MSDTRWDIIGDKMAEYEQQLKWARQDYCNHTCEKHNAQCPYYDSEEEDWDYGECFREKG